MTVGSAYLVAGSYTYTSAAPKEEEAMTSTVSSNMQRESVDEDVDVEAANPIHQ